MTPVLEVWSWSLSTAQGPEHGTLRGHVARVTWQQMCLKVSQLFGPKSLKTLHVSMFDSR